MKLFSLTYNIRADPIPDPLSALSTSTFLISTELVCHTSKLAYPLQIFKNTLDLKHDILLNYEPYKTDAEKTSDIKIHIFQYWIMTFWETNL